MADETKGPPAGFGCFQKHKTQEGNRRVVINSPQAPDPDYKSNKTSTTKYNVVTFLPKALFEQYRRVANIYFTTVAALSFLPFSPARPFTYVFPVVFVIGVSLVKELIEDTRRGKADRELNNSTCDVLDRGTGKFVTKAWKDLLVGDIVMVMRDKPFPADLLFLSSENDDGLCYIETMNLDGETNLKIRKALDETKDYKIAESVTKLTGAVVDCDPPNTNLYAFQGNLVINNKTAPITQNAILLRGSSLKNTKYILGSIIYAGHDSKVMMNATDPPSKRSSVERRVDALVLMLFGLLLSWCLINAAYIAWWTNKRMRSHWYLDPFNVDAIQFNPNKIAAVGGTNFISAFILYGYLIPISLYVTIEIVKVGQAVVFVSYDREMYDEETDTPAVARTSNLNEELGMVRTVLSDKTGTLTRNLMEFFKVSIAGVQYGQGNTEIERAIAVRNPGRVLAPDPDPTIADRYKERYFNFYDPRLMDLAWNKQQSANIIEQFFRLLAICHTVIPDGPAEPDKIKYEAESPDESALVVGAKCMGFFFKRRTNTHITVEETTAKGTHEVEYELLTMIPFSSARKRMSLISRSPDGKVTLYIKGADTMIFDRLDQLSPHNQRLIPLTNAHLEEYGSAGLRTLCLAYAELDPKQYEDWAKKWADAQTDLTAARDDRLEELGEEIERGLTLLGCTAIEDKLQEGLSGCITQLAQAGIRIWVLTGDKVETAINIGYACSLLDDTMTQHKLTVALEGSANSSTDPAVAAKVKADLEEVERQLVPAPGKNALIIDGKALQHALKPDLAARLLRIGNRCDAVICCRVSPLQKAQVTMLVRKGGDVTLAIGDGANDVGMIQKAHIGVGISGREGRQAVMNSDFAIAQFRFLSNLVLVHGRYNYKRICRMICFFLYKNLIFGSCLFVFNSLAVFSSQLIFDDMSLSLYNVVFTSIPPIIVGLFDRDLNKDVALRFPGLYRETQNNHCFSWTTIFSWFGAAGVEVAIMLAVTMSWAGPSTAMRSTGQPADLFTIGTSLYTFVVLTVHLHLGVCIEQWSWPFWVTWVLDIALWWFYLLAYGALGVYWSKEMHNLFQGIIGISPQYWLFCLCLPLTAVFPWIIVRTFRRLLRPADHQIVAEVLRAQEKQARKPNAKDVEMSKQGAWASSINRASRNTGYVPGEAPGAQSFMQPINRREQDKLTKLAVRDMFNSGSRTSGGDPHSWPAPHADDTRYGSAPTLKQAGAATNGWGTGTGDVLGLRVNSLPGAVDPTSPKKGPVALGEGAGVGSEDGYLSEDVLPVAVKPGSGGSDGRSDGRGSVGSQVLQERPRSKSAWDSMGV